MLKIKPDARAVPALPGLIGLAALALMTAGLVAGLIPTPHLSLLARAPTVVVVHLLAALAALGVGTALLILRKGRALHKALGWTWVLMMGTTAASSFFIRGINDGAFSWIHLLSGWTLMVLPFGVVMARRHRIALHRRAMTGAYVGGLLIAGAFTFVPGRLMWRLFFG